MAKINKQKTTYWSRLSDGFPIEIIVDEEQNNIEVVGAGDKCMWNTQVQRLLEITTIIRELQKQRADATSKTSN